MDWLKLIAARKQTLNFNPHETTDWNQIEKILDLLHRYLPSKQNQCPYQIDVLGWNNPELRTQIFYKTLPPDDNNEFSEWEWNPQTLAPVLFCLSSDSTRTAKTEIGMAGLFIVYAATDLGYHTGFCGCINDGVGIAKLLGYHDLETRLIIGIGIKDCELDPHATNPLTGRIMSKPKAFDGPKPDRDTYCRIRQ
ncbi:MAG: hypothetical protein ACO3YZ_06740 [Candidatus Nanopelagicaceae bacterium]